MKYNWLVLLNVLFPALLMAQVIPASRLTDWSNPGYRGDGALNCAIMDVTTLGVLGDSITDNSNLVNTIINGSSGSRTVLYFPPGIYLFNAPLFLRDSIVLRGASAGDTRFKFNFNGNSGNGISISGGSNSSWYNVTSGYDRGNYWITVADSGQIQAGDWAELREQNGAWDTQPISWADYSIGQLLEVTARSGDTLFTNKPIRITYDSSLHVQISKFIPVKEAGIECLAIERADSANCFCPTMAFYHAVDCWVRGVEGRKSISAHVLLESSSNVSVSGCYFHDAYAYDGTSMHGYGLALYYHTGQCLIENNILKHLRHSISFQCGANGNVVSNNYSLDPNRSEFPSSYGADISMHGHYPYANLFEGNIVQNIQLDQTWGPNGPGNTFFRNRAALYGILMTSGTVNSDSQLFVGNEVTSTTFLQGNYTLAGNGHFEWGNSIRGAITPTGTSNLPETSLYLTSPPVYWPAGSTWPCIGTPNAAGTGSNPAKNRFSSNLNLATCENYSPSTTIDEGQTVDDIVLYPNPSTGNFQLISKAGIHLAQIELMDMTGRVYNIRHQEEQIVYTTSLTLPKVNSGTYYLKITLDNRSIFKKIIVL
jgi:hypothetical protein